MTTKKTQPDASAQSDARPARVAEESDFCSYEWTGQAAADKFFRLHETTAFGGTGSTGVVLPPNCFAVSRRPTVGAAVVNAYAHGLEYAERVVAAGGFGLFLTIFAGIPFGYATADMWRGIVSGPFSLLVLAALIGFCTACLLLLFRLDTVGYRYTPVLFNRASGKVHVFRPEVELFSLRPLWGGGRFSIETYDWACVRAQVSRFRVTTGKVAQDNAQLSCIVFKAPDQGELVAQFPLGVTTSALAVQNLLDHWEHIRRYMEYEGPMFPEGEGPYKEVTTQSLLGAVFFGQPFIGPGAKEAFETTDMTLSFILVVWQLFAVFLFPVTLTIGLLRWASSRIRSKPKWPAEILASVGGKVLTGAELDAWRKLVPEKPTVCN
mgnify:CR=1 FL=1